MEKECHSVNMNNINSHVKKKRPNHYKRLHKLIRGIYEMYRYLQKKNIRDHIYISLHGEYMRFNRFAEED